MNVIVRITMATGELVLTDGDPLTLAAEDFFRMRFVQATNSWYRIA